MPKDLQTFVITSVAVTGIGLFWAQTTKKCFETMISIFQNQLFVEDEKEKNIREQIRDINLLISYMKQDKEIMEIKALEAVHAEKVDGETQKKALQEVQELKNKIIEQVKNILPKAERLLKEYEDYEKDIGWFRNSYFENVCKIKNKCIQYREMVKDWENVEK